VRTQRTNPALEIPERTAGFVKEHCAEAESKGETKQRDFASMGTNAAHPTCINEGIVKVRQQRGRNRGGLARGGGQQGVRIRPQILQKKFLGGRNDGMGGTENAERGQKKEGTFMIGAKAITWVN